jgi:hypothetical protein
VTQSTSHSTSAYQCNLPQSLHIKDLQLLFSLAIGSGLVRTITGVVSLGYKPNVPMPHSESEADEVGLAQKNGHRRLHMRHAFVPQQPKHESTVG